LPGLVITAHSEFTIGRMIPTRTTAGFTGTLAIRIVQLRPRDPESKGIVERHNAYFETCFMPGRSFVSPGDFNARTY
jgi:hypothetical protein